MICYGKSFAEKTLEAKGRKYDSDVDRLAVENAALKARCKVLEDAYDKSRAFIARFDAFISALPQNAFPTLRAARKALDNG